MKLKNYLFTASLLAGLFLSNRADAQWTRNAATLQTYVTNTSDNVGIGTTNPLFKLDIQSSGNASMSFKSTTGNANVILDRFASNTTAGVNYRTNGTPTWQTGMINNDNFVIRNVNLGSPAIYCSYTNNNVGIGNTAPTNKLSVTGSANFTGFVGIGITAPATQLHVVSGAAATDTIAILGRTAYTGTAVDVVGLYGDAATNSAAGYGIGVVGRGNYFGLFGNGGYAGVVGTSLGIGVDGEAFDAGNTEFLTGVQGLTSGGDVSVGVYGSSSGALNNYGLYGDQQDTAAGTDYAVVCLGDLYYWRAFAPSDARLKSNIMPYTGALDKINQLTTATYTFNHAKYPGMALPGGNQVGFMADNVQKVFPNLVKQADLPAGATRDARGKVTYHSIPDVMQVNYIGLIPVLAEAIKEQSQSVSKKETEMNARMTQLENEIAQLKSMLQEKKGNVTETGSLLQNVPNPANGNTTISFYLPENSKGVLQVSDVNGKVVKSFNVSGSGMQDVLVNTTSLSSGSYTYSLSINGKVADSKTMVINK